MWASLTAVDVGINCPQLDMRFLNSSSACCERLKKMLLLNVDFCLVNYALLKCQRFSLTSNFRSELENLNHSILCFWQNILT